MCRKGPTTNHTEPLTETRDIEVEAGGFIVAPQEGCTRVRYVPEEEAWQHADDHR
jgi:hypothetical protein